LTSYSERRQNASNRSCSSAQTLDTVEREVFPSPASSHNDSTSRIDKPRTKPPITSAFNGSVRNSRLQCHFGNNFETNGIAASRACGISIRSSPSAVCKRRGRNPFRIPDS
jgi:hypothetical protein